jgi:hypothetical protein
VAELAPSLYDTHIALAATYQQLEQAESWRIAAQRAIDLTLGSRKPTSSSVILSYLFWAGREVEDAAAQFKPEIERGPLILREIDTGRLYANVGRMTEAAAHLQRAFAVDASCARVC